MKWLLTKTSNNYLSGPVEFIPTPFVVSDPCTIVLLRKLRWAHNGDNFIQFWCLFLDQDLFKCKANKTTTDNSLNGYLSMNYRTFF